MEDQRSIMGFLEADFPHEVIREVRWNMKESYGEFKENTVNTLA